MSQSGTHNLDARTAELIARQLNSAFMNACGFSMDHPTTERALEIFHDTLSKALIKDPSLSLILDRGSLYLEKHPVGTRFNPRRLMDSFNEMGLESISFSAGLTAADARALVSVLSTLTDYPSLDAAEADLRQRQSGAILFNHIVYRKVTSEQKVVSSTDQGVDQGDAIHENKPHARLSSAGERVLNQLDSFFSLSGLAGDPDAAAEQLEASADADPEQRARLVEHLQKLAREVEFGGGDAASFSQEELFTAMTALRQRLHKAVSARQDVDQIMEAGNEVISEVDELTYSTLVGLVCEEYRGGNFSVQRMAQIVNRMLPDAGDLKRLLPRLKTGLMKEGMPLDKYTDLVHELSNELRGEHLVRALEGGAEEVGMDVDEIVRQIREDPAEATRLVVLASELRRGGVGDDQQLSSAFTDYFERISRKLALSPARAGKPTQPGSLSEQLGRVQKELIERMSEGGLAPEAARQLEMELAHRRAQKSSDKVAEPKKPTEIPRSVLSVSNTARFLKHEVKSAHRYGNPFSAIKLLVEWLVPTEDGASRRPRKDDIPELLPELYDRIVRLAREELDLVGSLEKSQRAVPFIILPMTGEEGAGIFSQRLLEVLADPPFRVGEADYTLTCTVTVVGFDTQTDSDANAFIQRLNQLHQANRADATKQAARTPSRHSPD
ncbi:hypothetical protein [Wenzhouxiangella sp. EGI_FJ10305]|uniref:hypothetical protein n=1 Tax=Wenzhouxiangella sp. EGI_FJ10305 TaxID=3243768 RepID=UPI0035DFE89F